MVSREVLVAAKEWMIFSACLVECKEEEVNPKRKE
jgi:hypothetical protein